MADNTTPAPDCGTCNDDGVVQRKITNTAGQDETQNILCPDCN